MIPKVSIVIPAYNERQFIMRAIRSAFAQSLDNVEVVVVDDASTDDTVAVVGRAMSAHPQLRLVRHERNKGLSQARLSGLNASLGDYVQFLDADDTIEPDSSRRLYERAVATGSDVVVMGMRQRHRLLRVGFTLFYPSRLFNKEVYDSRELLPVLLGKRGLTLSVCDKLYSRRMLQSLRLPAERRFMGEDMLMNMRVFNTGVRLSWIDYIGYNYTSGGGSSMSPVKMWESDKLLYKRCREVLTELDAGTDANERALAQGIADALVSSVASRLVVLFRSRARLRQWLADELCDNFWDDVADLLVEPRHQSVANRDVGQVMITARHTLAAHRLNYLLAPLFR